MVSCCGQAKDEPANSQPYLGAGPGIIDSQPAYQPVLNYNNNGFQPPNVPTPPVAHPYDHNAFLNQAPMREFGAVSPSQQTAVPSTFTGTTYNNGSNFNTISHSIARPQSTHSPPPNQPPMREFGAVSPSQQPSTFTGATYNNGSNFNTLNHTITRPQSSQSPHSPPPKINGSIQDEGKMSVSIDFGVYLHVTSLHSLIRVLVQAQHSLVL